MEFRLLGALEVEANGVDLTPARRQHRALLALLLLHEGEAVSTDDLVEALWGDAPPETAQKAIQGHISALRKSLGHERIETRPPGYVLRLAEGDKLDIRVVEEIAAAAPSNGRLARSEKLREALALFRGEPLAEFRYQGFASEEAGRLEALRLAVLEEQIDLELHQGRHEDVVPELERLIADHPFREGLRAQLMLALYRSGRQADALETYQEARSVLVGELGIEPSSALQRLEQQILNQDPELAAPDMFASARHRSEVPKPVGIVTFLFAEVEASALEPVRTVAGQHGGFEVDTERDSFLAAFARARDAVAAAVGIQRATRNMVRLRIGINSADEGHWEPGVRAAASISSAAHSGQILLSQTTRELLRETSFDDADLRDLGKHRLKDLMPAQRLFQLVVPELDDEFPPLRSLENRPTNLPLQPTPLVGREREIRDVADMLASSGTGLVTLTGTGGTGKTRLGLQVAAELLDDFVDGVFFVELAPLADPALVLTTVAQTLTVPATSGDTVGAALGRFLGEWRILLVLDNFEHVLAAAPSVAALAGPATAAKILVTSRVPLHVAGERVYMVSPLEIPREADDPERLLRCDSVALFASRARSVRADFAVTGENSRPVAEICTALEGLPLAIELAATRAGVLSPSAMLERLDDRLKLLKGGARDAPARQRTLRATIDWSYDLLEPEQQRLFVRLAVFAGGSTLEAVESVCGEGLDVVDGLASLTDNGLARVDGTEEEPRFGMLETIREYAAERLEESDEAADLHRRHAEHFLALAEEAEPHLFGSPGGWLDRLERELDNFRAALDRLEALAETELNMRLAGALWRYWYQRGPVAEGRRRLEYALSVDDRPTAARAKALNGAAVMVLNTGDPDIAKLRAEEGMSLHRSLGDEWGAAYSEFMLGSAVMVGGDPVGSQPHFDESIRIFREHGDEHSALLASRNLARGYYMLGDHRRALALFEDNLRRASATSNERMEASALGQLARYALEDGRVGDAASMLQASLRIHSRLGDILDTAVELCTYAAVLARQGKTVTATQVLSSLAALGDQVGGRSTYVKELSDEMLPAIRSQLDEANFAEAWEQGRRLTLGEAVGLALTC
jgi:predicted ATPase/DNA-binding SARP family transcriptional activator